MPSWVKSFKERPGVMRRVVTNRLKQYWWVSLLLASLVFVTVVATISRLPGADVLGAATGLSLLVIAFVLKWDVANEADRAEQNRPQDLSNASDIDENVR